VSWQVGYARRAPPKSCGHPAARWPYDIYSYVTWPGLAAEATGACPVSAGYGTTRFLANATPRNGQQAVLAVDILAVMEALHIAQAIVAGCDWGARTANILAGSGRSAARPWSP